MQEDPCHLPVMLIIFAAKSVVLKLLSQVGHDHISKLGKPTVSVSYKGIIHAGNWLYIDVGLSCKFMLDENISY